MLYFLPHFHPSYRNAYECPILGTWLSVFHVARSTSSKSGRPGFFRHNRNPPLRVLLPPQLPKQAKKAYSALRWLMALVEDVVKLEPGARVEEPTALQAAAMWENVEAKFERWGVREGQVAWTTLVKLLAPEA